MPKPIERGNLERVLKRVLPEDRISYVQLEAPEKKTEVINKYLIMSYTANESDSESELQDMAAEKSSQASPQTSLDYNPADILGKLASFGIDTSAGLLYCAGSEEFYIELLESFCEDSKDKIKTLKEAYESKDWKSYVITIHTLKGNLKTTGADALSNKAEGLQKAGENLDIDYIDSFHNEFLSEFDVVINYIREALS